MGFLTSNIHWFVLAASLLMLLASVVLYRRQKKVVAADGVLGLQHIVTLNSGGWLLLCIVAALGAVVMIGSSAAIGIDYWTGLAINADKGAGRIKDGASWHEYWTVGVVSFCILALFFELMSDLGTPLSSGFRQRRNVALANFVLVATIGCVFMSLVTKWGYYDDKAAVRRIEAAQVSVEDGNWHSQKTAAEAEILRLQGTPSEAALSAQEAAITATVSLLEDQLKEQKAARDAIPESHSTNRLRAGEVVMEITNKLAAAQAERAAVAAQRDDLGKLNAARETLRLANAAIEKNAGRAGSSEGGAGQKAGDWIVVRVIRVALHQFLCWLFPLVFFESVAAFGDARKKEEANKKRRDTARDKANTVDVNFTDVTAKPAEPLRVGAQGYYDDLHESEASEKTELKRRKQKKSAGDAGTAPSPGYDNGAQDGEANGPPDDDGAMNAD